MVLNDTQVKLVQDSWAALGNDYKKIGLGVFNKAFELDPDLKKLFTKFTDAGLGDHVGNVMKRFGESVGQLKQQEDMISKLKDLGGRHPGYGVTSKHKPTVGAGLLHYMETALGSKWNADTKAAWEQTWEMVMKGMGY